MAGVACSGLLATVATGASMRPAWWVALLAAVWSIYTADHLMDAYRTRAPLVTDRHRFHRCRARALAIALVGALALGALAATQLRPAVQVFGVTLGVAVVGYLASAQGLALPHLPKELAAGTLYAAGVWGGPLLMMHGPIAWPALAAGLQALAAVANLMALGVFEAGVDREHGSRSLALRWGPGPVRRAVMFGAGAAALGALGLASTRPAPIAGVFAVLAVEIATPALMLAAEPWFRERDRYRSWGDAVFLLGAVPRLIG